MSEQVKIKIKLVRPSRPKIKVEWNKTGEEDFLKPKLILPIDDKG